jgi:hypothetical protein
MRRATLITFAILLSISVKAQFVCDTCLDVNGKVSALHFVNDSVLAVAGEFDSTVLFEEGYGRVNRGTGVLEFLPDFNGTIYSTAALANGDLALLGNFRHQESTGQLALMRNNQIEQLVPLNLGFNYGIMALGNRVVVRTNYQTRYVTKPNSLERDSSITFPFTGSVSLSTAVEGCLFMRAYFNGSWQNLKVDTNTYTMSTWFEECSTCSVWMANIYTPLDSGRVFVEALSNHFDTLPQPAKTRILLDTAGNLLATSDAVYSANGDVDAAAWNYLSSRVNGKWYYSSMEIPTGAYYQSHTLYVKDEFSQQIDSFLIQANADIKSIRVVDQSFIIRGNFDSINGLPTRGYAEVTTPGFQLHTYASTLSSIPAFKYKRTHGNHWYYSFDNLRMQSVSALENLIFLDVKHNQVVKDFTTTGTVRSMEMKGDTLLLGGNFTSINGLNNPYLAGYVFDSDAWVSGLPDVNGTVADMALIGDSMWLGGGFDTVSGVEQHGIALFSRDFSFLQGQPQITAKNRTVTKIGHTKNTIALKGSFSNYNGQHTPYGVLLDRKTGIPFGIDTSRYAYATDTVAFRYIQAFGRNDLGSILGVSGLSYFMKEGQGSGVSFMAQDTLPTTGSMHVNVDCDDDPWYMCGTTYALEQKGHQVLAASDFVTQAIGHGLNFSTSQRSYGLDFVYPDGTVNPVNDLNAEMNTSYIGSSTVAQSSIYFAAGSSDGYTQRYLKIGKLPVVPNILVGERERSSLCLDTTAIIRFDVTHYKGDNPGTVSYEVLEGGDVITQIDTSVHGDTISFTLQGLKKSGQFKLAYSVTDSHYGKKSYTYDVKVKPLPETPVLTLNGLKVESSVDTLPHYWVTENGPYLGWNLPYINVSANHNVYSAYTIGANGCLSYLSNIVSITGIADEPKREILIFPNPAGATLSITGISRSAEYRLFGIEGILYRQGLIQEGGSIELGGLSPGMYVLELSDDAGRSLHRVIKE